MNRLLSAALLSSVLAQAPLAHAAESQECGPAVLATLGRALKVAHFAPGPDSDGQQTVHGRRLDNDKPRM